LLAFLIAFTFGMANSRYEERRHAVLEEANVIGTAYLRADLLPDQLRSETKDLLRRYVDIRMGIADPNLTDDIIDAVISQSEPVLDQLWEVAVAATDIAPSPFTSLFVQTTNDMIHNHTRRIMTATRSSIPFVIWICLFLVATFGFCAFGLHSTSSTNPSLFPTTILVLAFASVLTVVQDIDSPTSGILRTDQSPMFDLSKSMATGGLND
jgi:hypothetical protein